MPHTTFAYPFESHVGEFALELSQRFSNASTPRSFLLMISRRGDVSSLHFKDESESWYNRVDEVNRIREEGSEGLPHLLYDPLDDGKEYTWLSWHLIEQPVMEKLIKREFVCSDFQPFPFLRFRVRVGDEREVYPSTWGVMF